MRGSRMVADGTGVRLDRAGGATGDSTIVIARFDEVGLATTGVGLLGAAVENPEAAVPTACRRGSPHRMQKGVPLAGVPHFGQTLAETGSGVGAELSGTGAAAATLAAGRGARLTRLVPHFWQNLPEGETAWPQTGQSDGPAVPPAGAELDPAAPSGAPQAVQNWVLLVSVPHAGQRAMALSPVRALTS